MYSRWAAQTRSRTLKTKNGVATKDPYEYQPLRTSATIRLIKIYPQRVKGCIACEVYHFDHEEQNKFWYRALSYVWGDPQATRQIFIKGPHERWRPFPLHENLWQFLNHAWEQKLFDQFFWTDRLCLNQDNPEEISQQVPRMRTIYENAELALIWLDLKGEEERCLAELERQYYQPARGDKPAPICPSIDGATMLKIINHPYWTRVWIVQEIAVSREVCVVCRDTLIPMENLFDLFWWLPDYIVDQVFSIEPLREMCNSGGNWPLSRILTVFAKYQSSRPVDRLYGMLGLVINNDDGTSPTDYIQVDYGRPTLHVFLDAMFESSPTLREFGKLRQCLGDWNTYDSHSLLEGYITHSKTMQRHKNLARIALQALKACNILTSGQGTPSKDFWVVETQDELSGSSNGWTPGNVTLEQSAAVIGVTLARSSSGTIDHWKARRQSRDEATSPWRCVTHRSADMPSYELVIRAHLTRDLAPECVVEACAEQSQSCGGSLSWSNGIPSLNCDCYLSLHCEIPRAGLCLSYRIYGYKHYGSLTIERRN